MKKNNNNRNPWVINTEILSDSEIKNYFVDNGKYLLELQDNESYLIEGCRGSGKTMLMKYSELELLENFEETKILPIYISFSDSLKLDRYNSNDDSSKNEIFIRWSISKIIKELIATYTKKLGYEIDMNSSFERFFKSNSHKTIVNDLPTFINDLEIIKDEIDIKNISINYELLWDRTVDIAYFKQFINEFIEKHHISNIIFYFDEAAHTLFPYQQELFFTIFKKLKSNIIACKASVYPLITHYGNDFQQSQDAKKISVDKDDESENLMDFFQSFYNKRIHDDSRKEILENNLGDETFKTIVYSSSGNPRRFLNLIEKIRQDKKITKAKLTSIIREHSHNELWEYHTKLVQGNIDLRGYAEVGRKFIEEYIIPKLQDANKKPRDRKVRSFAIESEANDDFKKMLKTLEYSGIIDFKKQLQLREGNVGNYYTLNLSLCFSENILTINDIGRTDLNNATSLTANSPIIKKYTTKILELFSSNCPKCKARVDTNSHKFCPNCGNDLRGIENVFEKMLSHSIDSLKIQLIGDKIRERLKNKFHIIKDLMDAEDGEIMKIQAVGVKRLEYIRIAIKDYISG